MSFPQRIVQRVKWIIAHVLSALGVVALLRRRRAQRREVIVLWLHRVDGTADRRVPMAVPPEVFRDLVEKVAEHYRLLTAGDCARVHVAGGDRAGVLFTFDDGYEDNARAAWPVLRDAGGGGLFFLVSEFVAGRALLWWERVALARLEAGAERYPVKSDGEATYGAVAEAEIEDLKRLPTPERELAVDALPAVDDTRLPRALTWLDARRMISEGADVGGHSVTHPVLPRCDDRRLADEMTGCRDEIAREVGETPRFFAYPNGSTDARVVEAARAAGYTHAFTTEKGVFSPHTDPYRIPRIGVSEPKYSLDGRGFSWPVFECEMLGVFDVLLARRWRRTQRSSAAS